MMPAKVGPPREMVVRRSDRIDIKLSISACGGYARDQPSYGANENE